MERAGEEKGSVQGGGDGVAKCGNYDWKRKGAGRHNAEEEGGCALCAGDKVERKQGEGHWQWLQVVLIWRGWEEKWGRNYIEKRSD